MIAALVAEVTALDGELFAGLLLMFLAGCMWLAGRIGAWFDRPAPVVVDERDLAGNVVAFDRMGRTR